MQQRDNPAALVGTIAMQAVYGTRHPYGFTEIGTEASVKAMTRDDMQAFWKENFVPNNAALVVAGDITMAELRALAEKAFGAWQRGTPDAARSSARRRRPPRALSSSTSRAARRRSCASPRSARSDRRPTSGRCR